MLPEILNRYSSFRSSCKLWSVLLAVAILLFGGWGHLLAVNVLWAAMPILLLGLVDAGYAAQERRCLESWEAGKGTETAPFLMSESGSATLVRTLLAVVSLSVWPFYLALFAVVAFGGAALPVPVKDPSFANHAMPVPMQQPYLQTVNGPMALPGQNQSGMPRQALPPQTAPQGPGTASAFGGRPPTNPNWQRVTPPAAATSANPTSTPPHQLQSTTLPGQPPAVAKPSLAPGPTPPGRN